MKIRPVPFKIALVIFLLWGCVYIYQNKIVHEDGPTVTSGQIYAFEDEDPILIPEGAEVVQFGFSEGGRFWYTLSNGHNKPGVIYSTHHKNMIFKLHKITCSWPPDFNKEETCFTVFAYETPVKILAGFKHFRYRHYLN